jgi:hypothetical protein
MRFETSGAICREVTLRISRIARNTPKLSDITFKVSKGKTLQAPLVSLAKMERSLDCNKIESRY